MSVEPMSSLFARIANPRDRLDYLAAIGARASRLTKRIMPSRMTQHGFHDPHGFADACRYNAKRNDLYRALCRELAQRAQDRFPLSEELYRRAGK